MVWLALMELKVCGQVLRYILGQNKKPMHSG